MAHSCLTDPPDSTVGLTENEQNPGKVENKREDKDKDMEGLKGRRVHNGYERGK